jgi:hypothetical protein
MDGIHHRRSVRNYTSQTIEKNVIHTLLDAAVHCHPGWNVCDETNVSTPELKIRAECGNTTCSDLCGGRRQLRSLPRTIYLHEARGYCLHGDGKVPKEQGNETRVSLRKHSIIMGEVQLTAFHKKTTHWDSLPLAVLGVISSVSGKGRNPNT